MRALRFICAFFLLGLLGLSQRPPGQFVFGRWMRLPTRPKFCFVGEIVEISAVEKIDADKTRWNTPLLRMAAEDSCSENFQTKRRSRN